MDTLTAGDKLGKYVLEKKLGQGSSGFVWLGKMEDDNEKGVVIKVIPLCGWRKQEFEREVEALEALKHPNVVELYDWFTENKHGILVIEQLDRDLLDFLDGFSLSENEARMMFKQILSGIGFLHSKCTAHMDIKPENILIRGSNLLKIADLGSTFTWEEKWGPWKSGRAGTSFYCAPEVKSGKPYLSDKADIWSLGITLHVMITGFWPYLGQTEKEVLSNAKKGKIDLAKQYLSDDLIDFLNVMLNLNPENRPNVNDLLKHKWFDEEKEASDICFTPRGNPSSVTRPVVTSFSSTLTDPEEIQSPTLTLPNLALDGLKSPRQCLMSPRVGQLMGEQLEDGMIRPSPRNLQPNQKQTKLGKILHNFRKGIFPGKK